MKTRKSGIFNFACRCLFILFIIEIALRIFFHLYFIQHPLFFKVTDIPDVGYLMRDFDFNNYQLKDKPRIAILGDYISIHKGADGKNYPELLDQKLKSAFEIINTGATFYSLPEEMSLLKNKLINYHPEIIVFGYVLNDLCLRNKFNALIPLNLERDIYRFKMITPLAIKYFRILYLSRNLYPKSYALAPRFIQYCLKTHKDPKLADLLMRSLDELSRIQKEIGTRVVFVVVPIFYNFNDPGINYMNDLIVSACQKRNLDCVNLLHVFKRNHYPAAEVKEDDGDIWHPNALGNEIIAQQIYEHIINDASFKRLVNTGQDNS